MFNLRKIEAFEQRWNISLPGSKFLCEPNLTLLPTVSIH